MLSSNPRAEAATATSTMAVSAVVVSFCTVAALPLAFGNYASLQLDATTTITVTCTATTSFNIGLDAGTGVGADTTTRRMSLLSNTLTYRLFSNAGRTSNWGNIVGTDTLAGTGLGTAQVLTVYGRILPGQLIVPGTYLDTITATITY